MLHEYGSTGKPEDHFGAAFDLFHEPGSAVEIRALGLTSGTFSGFFDDRDKFVSAVAKQEQIGRKAIYVTLNPLTRDLLAVRNNRVGVARDTAADKHVTRRRWLLADCDPERSAANISSTEEEKDLAYAKLREITDFLRQLGFSEPVLADSGNGYHAIYPIDLPDDAGLVKQVLEGLSAAFTDDRVKIDTSVFNPARITKLYGTMVRKGEDTEERPHRRSSLMHVPDTLEPVSRELLEKVADLAPEPPKIKLKPLKRGKFDVAAFIDKHDIEVLSGPKTWDGAGVWRGSTLWIVECPFGDHEVDRAAHVIQNPEGVLSFRCKHNRCQGLAWQDFRKHFEKEYEPHEVDKPRGIGTAETTDIANAERFVAQHGEHVRWVLKWEKWIVWDGKRWAEDGGGALIRKARETARNIVRDAAEFEDRSEGEKLAKWGFQSQSKTRIDAMISLAKADLEIKHTELDKAPWLFNTENGTLDLRTGKPKPHDPEDLITKIAGVRYDPHATAPTWDAFLEQILPAESLRRFLQRLVGYSLTGSTSAHVLPFLYGTGSNGKTTVINAILSMMGDYGQQAAPDLLLAKHGAHPTELADLFGARFVASVEAEEGRRFAEALVKQLTGGDKVKARRMREDFWEFPPTHKIFLAANHKPNVRGTDHGFWRRIKLIPFTVTIPDEKQDHNLPQKLAAELPGILSWAVRGCLEWQLDGLGEPEEVRLATGAYRSEQDVLAAFIAEVCVEHPNAEVSAAKLYQRWDIWAGESGERKLSKRAFGQALAERGFESFRYTKGADKGRYGWRGIGLWNPDDDPDDDSEGSSLHQNGSLHRSLHRHSTVGNGVPMRDSTPKHSNGEVSEAKSEFNSSERPHTEVMPESGSLTSPLHSSPTNGHAPVEQPEKLRPHDEFALFALRKLGKPSIHVEWRVAAEQDSGMDQITFNKSLGRLRENGVVIWDGGYVEVPGRWDELMGYDTEKEWRERNDE